MTKLMNVFLDMAFNLLFTILVVVAVLQPATTKAIDVNLPEVKGGRDLGGQQEKEKISVVVTSEEIRVEDKVVSATNELAHFVAGHPEMFKGKEIIVAVDQKVVFGRVMKVQEAFYTNGVTNLVVLVREPLDNKK